MPLARHDEQRGRDWTARGCFYSHASCEAWLRCRSAETAGCKFLLTCPKLLSNKSNLSFYSHASCEAWLRSPIRQVHNVLFLLTCLLRGMTFYAHSIHLPLLFLLTCLLRGMTDCSRYVASRNRVSTHMPLARHDCARQFVKYTTYCFYSHASCEAWPRETFWVQ